MIPCENLNNERKYNYDVTFKECLVVVRKAVKATFILIPLFGIQLFVTIYRVPISKEGGLE